MHIARGKEDGITPDILGILCLTAFEVQRATDFPTDENISIAGEFVARFHSQLKVAIHRNRMQGEHSQARRLEELAELVAAFLHRLKAASAYTPIL